MIKNKTGKINMAWLLIIGIVALVLFQSGTFSNLSTAGGSGTPATQVVTTTVVPDGSVPDSLVFVATSKYANAVNPAGNLDFYDAGVDPKSANAVARVSTVILGTAYTGAQIQCGKKYVIVYENSTTRYAEVVGQAGSSTDYSTEGIVAVPCDKVNAYTGDATVDLTSLYGFKPTLVATLDDIFDETSTSGIMNGDTSNVSNSGGGQEIGNNQSTPIADGELIYDESAGNGDFYIDVSFSASSSNSELRDPKIGFYFYSDEAPEGTEVTAMTFALRSGSDLGIPAGTNFLTLWQNQEGVKINNIPSGTSATYRMTVTYDEAALDTTDQWALTFNDLNGVGLIEGQDVGRNNGATFDRVIFDAQA